MQIVGEKDFKQATEKGLVLVDFFATWCGPCRMMSMILDESKEEIEKYVKIVKVDVDESENIARTFGVLSIPTLVLLKDGKEVFKRIGLMQKDDLLELVKSFN